MTILVCLFILVGRLVETGGEPGVCDGVDMMVVLVLVWLAMWCWKSKVPTVGGFLHQRLVVGLFRCRCGRGSCVTRQCVELL